MGLHIGALQGLVAPLCD